MDQSTNIVPAIPANDVISIRDSDSPVHRGIHDVHNWRNILSFWVLGLCNGYGTTVMLSAAYDIIQRFDGVSVRNKYNSLFFVELELNTQLI